MKKLSAILLVLALCAPLASAACGGGAISPRRNAATAPPDDPTITTRVKTALINEPGISATIDVQTFQGVVTLSGKVKSKDEESKAVAVARSIRGVNDVKSKLEIQP
jgi:hyperosmotically inducible periplasmic protein